MRFRSKAALALVALAIPVRALAGPPSVGVTTGMDKVRPNSPVPGATSANVSAAGNEFEPFQIVIGGGDSGVTGVTASVSDLTGPNGARVAATEIELFRVALYDVVVPSNTEGAVGPWPDPLVPAVDRYFNEPRNAFPFDVPAGESRAIWVEILVPPSTPRGMYTGSVTVRGAGLPDTTVPVALTVRGFSLPPTASLRSAFGMNWDGGCIAHRGSYAACGDSGVEQFHQMYKRAGLDHRITLSNPYAPPHNASDWDHFDTVYGPLLDGTAPTTLQGARMTTLQAITNDGAELMQWRAHVDSRGWYALLFHYTCDEPPQTCAFSDIPSLATAPRAANVPVLVTTNINQATSNGIADSLDIIVPIVNDIEDKNGTNTRATYDSFVAHDANNAVWSYQSCMSHGCGMGCVTTSDPYFTGWPSYVIDVGGVQNRAMEWLSYANDISGELYFATQLHEDTAWADQCDFSGNGDGNLFYPGTAARVGGSDDIPIESIRLKLIREGMEDYEYLKMLGDLGDGAGAHQIARALFPHTYSAGSASPAQVLAARDQLAARIEALMNPTAGDAGVPPTDAGTSTDAGTNTRVLAALRTSAVTVDGTLTEFAGANAVSVVIPATGTAVDARMLWDDTNLYLGATVRDADIQTPVMGHDGELYLSDGVELLLDPTRSRSVMADVTDRHIIVTANVDVLDANGAGSTENRTPDYVRMATVRTMAGGYTVEIAIPWSALGVTPAVGLQMGGDVALNDARANGALSTADWAGLTMYAQPSMWNTIVLQGAPTGGDGGVVTTDAGGRTDAGAITDASADGSSALDGAASDGGTSTPRSGCGCRAAGGEGRTRGGLIALIAIAVVTHRRRRAMRRTESRRH